MIAAVSLVSAGVAGASVAETFRWTAVPKPTVALVADVLDCKLYKVETEGRVLYMTQARYAGYTCPLVLTEPGTAPAKSK